jgi:hypothetical protein
MEEETGWRKMHNEDLHNLYPSPEIVSFLIDKERRCNYRYYTMSDRKMIANVKQPKESELAGEAENQPQSHYFRHKSRMT